VGICQKKIADQIIVEYYIKYQMYIKNLQSSFLQLVNVEKGLIGSKARKSNTIVFVRNASKAMPTNTNDPFTPIMYAWY